MTTCGKEVCDHCRKSIGVGNVVNTCYSCNTIAHAKCAKKMKFVKMNNSILNLKSLYNNTSINRKTKHIRTFKMPKNDYCD